MKTLKADIPAFEGSCDTFIAHPEKRSPVVMLLMDAYGPRAWLYEMAEKIAAQGYYVFLPNLFYRVRRAPVVDAKFPVGPEDMPALRAHVIALANQLRIEQAIADAKAFLEFLSHDPLADVSRVGLTGYCMGGRIGLRWAAEFPDTIQAAASFHGGNLANDSPESPHRFLSKVKAELYIAHADNDQSMPPEQIDRLEKALQATSLRYETEIYKGAAHGYAMRDLPAGKEEALERHWQKLFSLLERNLKK